MTDPAELVQLQFSLTGADLERLIVVGSDLAYLIDLPRDRLLTHTEVRLCAGILRRLLVDGQLSAVWKSIGAAAHGRPTVEVTEIDTLLSQWPNTWIRYAWAGGAGAAGAHHTGLVLSSIPKEEHERYGSVHQLLQANPLPREGQARRLTVEDWLRTTSVAIQTDNMGLIRISRASVLKYFANHKGGVHFDPKRDFKAKVPRKNRQTAEHHLLDHGFVRVGHLSGPEFEVASMVQAVAEADWATELVRIAEDVAPADLHGDPNELKFWSYEQQPDGTGWATMTFAPRANA